MHDAVDLYLIYLQGPNYTISLDGHDKLAGKDNNEFPLCIYGGQDCWSGKILFLKIWTTNHKPAVVARYYFDYLCESQGKLDTNLSLHYFGQQ